MPDSNKTYRLVMDCPDRVGIVAAVSRLMADNQVSILEADHHGDEETHHFFMRHVLNASACRLTIEDLRAALGVVSKQFDMRYELSCVSTRKRVALFVSKYSHCLADLLHRWRTGEMQCDIPLVLSNHLDLEPLVQSYNVPFHHVPVDTNNKAASFQRMSQLCADHDVELVVLARYMQIVPKEFCEKFRGRMINIHHSFLPSFMGAKPYHQAFARGVKLIGATCHYVTEDLDEGPIIDQGVARVSHRETVEDLVRLGRDVETRVLARGVRQHLEGRVILHGNKTIVF